MGFALCQKLLMMWGILVRDSTAAVFRRHKIYCDLLREVRTQFQYDGILPPQIRFLKSDLLTVLRKDKQISQAGFKTGAAGFIGRRFPEGIQLAVVDDLKPHPGICDGQTVLGYQNGQRFGDCVMRSTIVNLIQCVPVPICPALRVHQHGTGSGGSKPTPIQHRFRFTSTHIVPAAVNPSLCPSVIIVTMGPAGTVALPGRNAHTAQRGYSQYAFFSAASQCAAQYGQRSQSALVRRSIGGVCIAPVIYGQSRLLHGFSMDIG